MKKMTGQEWLKSYFMSHKGKWIFFVLSNMVFWLVLFLSNVEKATISYGYLLVTSMALVYFIIDFYYFHKKISQLNRLMACEVLANIPLSIGNNHVENSYIQLLQKMIEERQNRLSIWDQKMSDLMDYYTLWTHQIKTPIAAIHLLLQDVLMKAEGHSQIIQQTKAAQQELFKIERYVESAIQYAKLESAVSDFRFESISLDLVIRQAIKKYATLFIHQKIGLEYETISLQVVTDEKWLVFVVEQVLSNALKYTMSGTIRIYMAEYNPTLLIIEDTGIGIHSEDLPRVFEKGFTGYNGRMDKKSTGIGLYLCQQITRKLGIEMSLSSKVGDGTQVKLNLTKM